MQQLRPYAHRPALGVAVGTTAFALLLVLLPASLGTAVAPRGVGFGHGGSSSGSGVLALCSHGLVNTHTGWVCEEARAATTTGYARGWAQLEFNASPNVGLSGHHAFYLDGALNLSAGFARASGTCAAGGSGYADIYVFWHVWVFDNNLSTYVSQSNSGYLWKSATLSCGSTWQMIQSPASSFAFSTSSYVSTGPVAYSFNGAHSYTFQMFLGCTAEASFTAPFNGTATGSEMGAFCNFPTSASSNTFTISKLLIR